jgi:hypothetical protein
MKQILFVAIFCLLSLSAYAERWEFTSFVGDTIYDPVFGPPADTLPVDDSIFVPIHANIDDINFYVGITTYWYWADKIDILMYSPQSVLVYLSHYSPNGQRRPYFNIWFDTQDSVDGPGVLQDYNGSDAYGWWRMRCYSVSVMPPNTYWREWKIEVYGTSVGITSSDPNIPDEYYLAKPYPNPFNSKVVLNFGMPQSGQAIIAIYDVLGRKICTLLDEQLAAGNHQATFNASDLASGVYFAKLNVAGMTFKQRMALIK